MSPCVTFISIRHTYTHTVPGILGLGHPQQVHVTGQDGDMRVLHRTPGIIWVPVCQEYVNDELEVGLPSDWLAE